MSARQAYLRAALYYDTASSFADGSSGPETYDSLWTAYRAAFDAAVACEPDWQKVAIPFEGSTLEGYFFRAPGVDGPRRTIILNNGSDGSVVDMLGHGAVAAKARGWNAITFDGPGQGGYWVPRAAAFEHRLAAVVADPGVVDLSASEVRAPAPADGTN